MECRQIPNVGFFCLGSFFVISNSMLEVLVLIYLFPLLVVSVSLATL
jgi:hypothetical protein